MSITADTVKHVANLARLKLEERELPPLVQQLSNILGLVEQLKELDTDAVTPMSHALDMPIPERPDLVVPTSTREAMLANAPDTEQGYFRVPKIIE